MSVRVWINEIELQGFLRREFAQRARLALAVYRKSPLRRDRAGYPFAQRPEDGSIRTYRGQHLLERSVRRAFTGRAGIL